MKFNRLTQFQKDTEKIKQYRHALAILYRLGIDQILSELGSAVDVPDDHPNIEFANAMYNQQAVGFRKCLATLFTLDETEIPQEERVNPDYGAAERMVAQGLINEDEAEELLKG